ncbi:MAG: DNA/RNA nuclease SfsA [Gammaproteobacteria bacterium]|nr:DNA/RNA nuclease SfsA [Gammaproteobacteria bacterium]
MKFAGQLIEARLIKRYKRFLADVELADGEIMTVHCANTGAMTGCQPVHARVWLSHSANPKRKYAYSWELVELENQALACINTAMTNRVAAEAIQRGLIKELQGYAHCQREVRYGTEGSRVDFLLSSASQQCFVEVKHVTLSLQPAVAAFPDAVTLRGQKHIRELVQQLEQGNRAVMLFVIMRTGVDQFTVADTIDADYAGLLREARGKGVEILAYKTGIDQQGIEIIAPVDVNL